MLKKTKFIILISVLVIVVVGSIIIAGISVYKPEAIKTVFGKPYSVVYLTSGEIYIGRLSDFPRLTMTDVYLLQFVNSDDPAEAGYKLAPLANTLWSPRKIYLNKDQVIFTAPIKEDSQVVQAIKNPDQFQNAPQQFPASSGDGTLDQTQKTTGNELPSQPEGE